MPRISKPIQVFLNLAAIGTAQFIVGGMINSVREKVKEQTKGTDADWYADRGVNWLSVVAHLMTDYYVSNFFRLFRGEESFKGPFDGLKGVVGIINEMLVGDGGLATQNPDYEVLGKSAAQLGGVVEKFSGKGESSAD